MLVVELLILLRGVAHRVLITIRTHTTTRVALQIIQQIRPRNAVRGALHELLVRLSRLPPLQARSPRTDRLLILTYHRFFHLRFLGVVLLAPDTPRTVLPLELPNVRELAPLRDQQLRVVLRQSLLPQLLHAQRRHDLLLGATELLLVVVAPDLLLSSIDPVVGLAQTVAVLLLLVRLFRERARTAPLARLALAVAVLVAEEVLPVEARDLLAHLDVAQDLNIKRL